MTRAEIVTRVQQRADRTDSTTQTQIGAWIDELTREIEREYPWAYTKKSQTATISANVKSFTLPTDLILHHPFSLLLQDEGTASAPEYTYLIKTEENFFDVNFPTPNITGTINYWKLTGGTNGVGFDVYPVPDADSVLKIASGHYYTVAGSSSNWLTVNQPDLIVEGTAAKLFEHYAEPQKADRAYFRYQQLLGNAIMQQKKMDRRGRWPRVKSFADDFPLAVATKKKTYGY